MTTIQDVPLLQAPSLDCAQKRDHIDFINTNLELLGVVKIDIGFEDDQCHYLEQVIRNLHQYHGHGLPIDHSATRGWFWDIRPMAPVGQDDDSTASNSSLPRYQARSETARDFPWHTDCSYESSPPRYFALQVLQNDRCGGGTLSILNVKRLLGHLSEASRSSLYRPEFSISVPPEFIKTEGQRQIVGRILCDDDNGNAGLRFREDIFTPLSKSAASAIEEFKAVLSGPEIQEEILHLHSECMPRGSIILVDNRKWLHARNEVKDPNRHLRRVRWDACAFE